jgi:hypothetical protein
VSDLVVSPVASSAIPPQRIRPLSTDPESGSPEVRSSVGISGGGRGRRPADIEGLRASLERLVDVLRRFAGERADPSTFGDFAKRLIDAARSAFDGDPSAVDIDVASGSLSFAFDNVKIEIRRDGGGLNVVVSQASLRVRLAALVRQQIAPRDPLILDLDGDGIATTTARGGRLFDLDGDGRTERVANVVGGDAFLALDRNGNGRIDDGRELFGDQHGAKDGFAELAKFDGNGDGTIDAADPVFQRLSLLDRGGRQRSLADAGISSLNVQDRTDANANLGGSRLTATSRYSRGDGIGGLIGNVVLDVVT